MQDLIIDVNIEIKCTSKFKYLAFTLTQDASSEVEINLNKQTRACIRKLHPTIWNRNLFKETKHNIQYHSKKYNVRWKKLTVKNKEIRNRMSMKSEEEGREDHGVMKWTRSIRWRLGKPTEMEKLVKKGKQL